MGDFSAVLSAARQLPERDRIRLIEELWGTMSPESEAAFSEEWAREIQRRADELDAGTAQTIPWSEIRQEALARLDHGKGN